MISINRNSVTAKSETFAEQNLTIKLLAVNIYGVIVSVFGRILSPDQCG